MKKVATVATLGAIGGALVLGTTVNAQFLDPLPSCASMQPGLPLIEGNYGWYLDGEHKLDIPTNWSVFRAYKELASYGWCYFETVNPSSHTISEVKVGDPIGEFVVTSAFGPRPSPCTGCSSYHAGIDINTPTGVHLFSPSSVEVSCKVDTNGGGIVAQFWYDDMFHQFLHLSQCVPGSKVYGDVFAVTGGTGVGTGPHLDYRVKMENSDGVKIRVYPPKQVLEFVVNPNSFAKY